MRIFVSRAIEQAMNTQKKLTDLGFEVHLDPIIKRNLLPAEYQDLAYTHIIFTSQNAVLSYCDHAFPKNIPCFTVGDKTAQLAEEKGFQVAYNAQGTIDDLIAYIQETNQDYSFLYPTADNAKPNLDEFLSQHKITYNRINIYDMEKKKHLSDETIKLFQAQALDCVLLYSTESMKHLFALLEQHNLLKSLETVNFIAIHFSLSEAVPQRFQKNFYYAQDPTEGSLFDIVKKLAKNRIHTQ